MVMEYMPAPPNTEAGYACLLNSWCLECQEHVVWLVTWCREPERLNTSQAKYKHEKQNIQSMESMCFHGIHSFNATMTRPNDQSRTQACKLHPLPIRRLYAAHGKLRLFTLKFQVAFDNHVHQYYLYAKRSESLFDLCLNLSQLWQSVDMLSGSLLVGNL